MRAPAAVVVDAVSLLLWEHWLQSAMDRIRQIEARFGSTMIRRSKTERINRCTYPDRSTSARLLLRRGNCPVPGSDDRSSCPITRAPALVRWNIEMSRYARSGGHAKLRHFGTSMIPGRFEPRSANIKNEKTSLWFHYLEELGDTLTVPACKLFGKLESK